MLQCLARQPLHSYHISSPTHKLLSRAYTAHKAARVPQSIPSSSTTKPNVSRSSGPASKGRIDGKALIKAHRKAQDEALTASQRLDRVMNIPTQFIGVPKLSLLDLIIPIPLSQAVKGKDSSSIFEAVRDQWINRLRNVIAMYMMAKDFAFPGILTKWVLSPQLFRTQSTRPGTWIAPIRAKLLESYMAVNEAIARRDEKKIKRITQHEYQEKCLKLIRSQPKEYTCEWKFHGEVAPCQVISLRTIPGHIGRGTPKTGNSLLVQLAVRFETLQTLNFYDRQGRLVGPDGKPLPNGQSPEPRRVLEYLVFENQMHESDEWILRDEMFEGVKPTFVDA